MRLTRRPVIQLVFFLLLLSLLAACSRQDEGASRQVGDEKTFDWSEYVSTYTGPVVSKESRILVRFVNDIIDNDKVGKNANDILEITPPVAGKIIYTTRRGITLAPDIPLQSGASYQVRVKTARLKGLPAKPAEFNFAFSVIKQAFDINISGLATNPEDDKSLNLTGTLVTADTDSNEKIEQMLTAYYRDKPLDIQWIHNTNGKDHVFSTDGIERQEQAGKLSLRWDGKAIGVDSKGERDIEVPALGAFKLIRVRAVKDDRQYILVEFSSALNRRQNLNGLVELSQPDFTTRIDGNRLRIYPANTITGALTVTIDAGIRNDKDKQLGQRIVKQVTFSREKPQVRFVGKGVILPDNKLLTIPFEAINVDSVQVTAFRIFENNIGQFLQYNKLSGNSNMKLVGRYLWRKSLSLKETKADKWNRYQLDASELLKKYPGGLFRLTLSINRGNATYGCPEKDQAVAVKKEPPLKNHEDLQVVESSGWDFAEDYYGQNGTYNWRDRKNPCKDTYYKYASGVSDSRNFMASNLGLLAKRGSADKLNVVVTDLRNATPLAGVDISVLNFQHQIIKQGKTDDNGFVTFETSATPFYLVASKGGQKGYLKLSQGSALPTSHFDVGGEKVNKGLKGYIYGERGVWRPGDDIYLTFVLQDKNKLIPDQHPVTMQLINPKGQVMQTVTNNKPVGDFYAFKLKTRDDALTGSWSARAILGGSRFSKKLKIETVVPNRLKVELDFGADALYQSAMPVKATLFGQWLHGATASDLKTDVAVKMYPLKTRFDRFTDMVFDDPARRFHGEEQTVFEGTLDTQGYARFEKTLLPGSEAPGMLSAVFTSRVFEKSGAFSSSRKRITYYPYDHFVGIKLPQGDAARGMLLTDTKHSVEIGSLDAHGNPVSLKQVRLTLYKINWKWWWDKSGDDLARYASAAHTSSLKSDIISTSDGRGKWEFEIKSPDWGRYLIRACDLKGRHCTGKIFYMDWPGWAGRAREQSGAGASALSFSADKPRYTVGETAHIQLPGNTRGRALVSIETGSGIIEQHWMEFGKDNTRFALPLSRDMSPNVYVSVTLIQPHANRDNDRPIRLYGVIPLMVEDPDTRLAPQLDSAEEWVPESRVEFSVSEKNGKAMTYTVAVVDEGLLGLTSFKTPDLHRHFYKKEALGVNSWDLFDEVTGSYSAELERLLALGGGDSGEDEDGEKDKKRFPPVVKFLGPFQLKAGETRPHSLTLPQYLGAVRVMLVAGEQGAYGKADKSVFVRQALTMLPTVPRVLGPDEELTIPVALFVSEDSIKQVELRLETDDHFEIIGKAKQRIEFAGPGEQMGFIRLKVRSQTGMARLGFIALSGEHESRTDITIDIRSANPPTRRQWSRALRPDEHWQQHVTPHGIKNTNQVTLEVSSLPPINLQQRLSYLIRYPHGCVEQVTSAVFPQLYLSSLVSLNDEQKKKLDNHVHAGLDRLRGFQTPDGGFMYWPGQGRLNPWATNYAGHFLLEAEKKGYQVPADMLDNWLSHQQAAARNWIAGTGKSTLDQAYRLYTLALAGYPELGAMNRLREMRDPGTAARWQLAAAYALAGVQNAASELVRNIPLQAGEDPHSDLTFGSPLRDEAIILNSLVLMGMNEDADALAKKIAAELSADKWYSTQSIAWSLLAMARHAGEDETGTSFQYQYRLGDGDMISVKADSPIYNHTLDAFPLQGQDIELHNTAKQTLYATILAEGVPPAGSEQASANDLSLQVSYSDLQGNAIDVRRLHQSTDLLVTVQVTNHTDEKIDNVALSQILPSGWEIHNTRMDLQDDEPTLKQSFDYQDIRDDRVYTYFNLKPEEQKTFSLKINATYLGHYYLPAVSVEAMYDASKQARNKGQWVEIIAAGQ